MERYKTFKDFYPYYIEEHSKPKTKLLHFIGTSISLFFLVQLVITFDPIYLIYALLSGYGFAWVAHFFIEKKISLLLLPIPFIVL